MIDNYLENTKLWLGSRISKEKKRFLMLSFLLVIAVCGKVYIDSLYQKNFVDIEATVS